MFGFVSRKKYRAALDEIEWLKASRSRAREGWDEAESRLYCLRANCFITNEKGHRVRYLNASPERQAKAEGRHD